MPYTDPAKARQFRKEQARRRKEAGLCTSCANRVGGFSANLAATNTMPDGGRPSARLPRYQGLGIDRHSADGVRGNPRPGDSELPSKCNRTHS